MFLTDERICRWCMALLYIIFSYIVVSYKNKNGKAEKKLKVKSDVILFWIFFLINFILAFIYFIVPSQISEFNLFIPFPVRIIGSIISLISLIAIRQLMIQLGNNYSNLIEINSNHSLLKEGIYSKVRHPIYSIYFCFYSGIFILSSNYMFGSSLLIVYIIFMYVRVNREEKFLCEIFGSEYIDYMKNTPRFIPKFY